MKFAKKASSQATTLRRRRRCVETPLLPAAGFAGDPLTYRSYCFNSTMEASSSSDSVLDCLDMLLQCPIVAILMALDPVPENGRKGRPVVGTKREVEVYQHVVGIT